MDFGWENVDETIAHVVAIVNHHYMLWSSGWGPLSLVVQQKLVLVDCLLDKLGELFEQFGPPRLLYVVVHPV